MNIHITPEEVIEDALHLAAENSLEDLNETALQLGIFIEEVRAELVDEEDGKMKNNLEGSEKGVEIK